MYMYTHIYIYTHTHTHIFVYIYIYICVCVCVSVLVSSGRTVVENSITGYVYFSITLHFRRKMGYSRRVRISVITMRKDTRSILALWLFSVVSVT